MESDKKTEAEFKAILEWLLAGAKQWAKACDYGEPLPEISINKLKGLRHEPRI